MKQRGIFEKDAGSKVWWICYYDQFGNPISLDTTGITSSEGMTPPTGTELGGGVFRTDTGVPPPPPITQPPPPPKTETREPPPPPPIELKFFGFASKPGEPKRVFLSQGEDVFVAGEGDIVDRRYKILRISPTSVEVEDVLNNHRQEIQLTQA